MQAQVNASPFDTSITPTTQLPNLEVAGFSFARRGAFTVNETIAYEGLNNSHAQRSLELMSLGNRIAIEKDMTYPQVLAILEDNNLVNSLLVDYIDDILAIGLDRYSETRRKSEVVTMFVQSRCNNTWTAEQTGSLLYPELLQIYQFAMGEYRGWATPPVSPTTTEEVGKLSPEPEPPSTIPSTGHKSTTTSKAAASPTPVITPPISDDNSLA
jgi:hypothetical protein